ncbi:hypothetical protein HY630_02495 [Candidatus Uhrbacteria bacterium]|nr:hypothetical protein [Candidatus Uhrbacteria bacterium]
MATPEERKAKLQAARLRARPISPTRFEFGRKHFGIADPDIPDELLHTPNTRAAGAKDLFDVADMEAKRRAALSASRLLGQSFSQAEKSDQASSQPQSERTAPEEPAQDQAPEQSRIASMLQRSIMQRTAKQQAQQQQEQQVSEETKKERDKLKQTAKAAVRRGAIYVLDLLAAALDISSAGITFLIDLIIYFFTLGWLNLEMIYGRYFAKGKSRYVGPLSWDPIPMPIDKDALILSGFVVAADIALALASLLIAFGGFCLVHDFVKVTGSITQAIQIGASLAQGQSGGLCLGGIIASAFGL